MKQMMFMLVLLLLASPCMAATVTIDWTASPSPGVDGYAVYDRNFQKPYDYNAPIWIGTGLTCTVSAPDDRQTAYVARAWKWGVFDLQGNRTREFSFDSNETFVTPNIVKPEPPRNLLVRILQALIKLFFGRNG